VFSGEWIDQIIGLDTVTMETVMARAPNGSDIARSRTQTARPEGRAALRFR
jgi:hypothetical protein